MSNAFVNCRSCGAVNDFHNTICRTCGYQLKSPRLALPNDPNVTRACEEEIAARSTPYPNLPPSAVNPNHEPYGHFTGRCPRCQSKDLWEDNLWYGCKNCGAWYGPDNSPAPRIVPNGR